MNHFPIKLAIATAISLALTACGGGGGDSGGSDNQAPQLSGSPLTSIEQDANYSFTPSCSDPDGDVLTYSATGLPAWATINSTTGVISGQPGEADVGESEAITLSVSDGSASVSLPAFTITVNGAVNTVSLTGKVLDGYISGASVFLDKNRNGVADAGEPTALSDDAGSYRLALSDADVTALPTSPIVALAAAGAKDISTGELFDEHPVVLAAPPVQDFDPAKTDFSQAISPFTTQLHDEIKESLTLVVSGDLDSKALELELKQAKAELVQTLAAKLDIETETLQAGLFDDFLAVQMPTDELKALADEAVVATDNLQESKQLLDDASKDLADNQQVEVSVKTYSFIEWHSLETLYLKEQITRTVTTQDDGSKTIEWKSTKYRLDSSGEQMLVAGEPLIYEISSGTVTENSDGSFEESMQYERDVNGDNERQFKGQNYQQGTYSALGKTYRAYFDESSPLVELPSWQGSEQDAARTYQGNDLKAAVLAENLSDVDFIQDITKSRAAREGESQYQYSFKQFDPVAGVFEEQPNYAETRTDTTTELGVKHEVAKDWQADGSVNDYLATQNNFDGSRTETTGKPIWPNRSDDDWQEYADYNWASEVVGSYWLEQSLTYKRVDGKEVVVSEGARYLLDSDTNAALVNSEGEKYQFNKWLSTTTQRSSELSVEAVTWTNFHLDDVLFGAEAENFTYSETELGQKVAYSVKYANDLWLKWEFPEWGGQNIDNLLAVVDAQLAANGNDYTKVDISELLVAGATRTAEQDWIFPTTSFIYDAQGNARTWYVVSNVFNGKFELQETTLPNLYADWKLAFLSGGFKIYVPGGYTFDDWNYTTEMVSMPPISEFDAAKGSFSFSNGFGWNPTRPFYLFLDKSEAQAKLAELSVINDGFSAEWLSDRTIYQVWFGGGDDAEGNPLEDVSVVLEVNYAANGDVTAKGLRNAFVEPGQVYHYQVREDGLLYIEEEQDEASEGHHAVCGSTADYIKTHFVVGEALNETFDNVDLFFFDQQKALDYAEQLTQSIPRCYDSSL